MYNIVKCCKMVKDMNLIFLINPMAGKGNDIEKLKNTITQTATKLNKDCEIYITKSSGDATAYVRQKCLESSETNCYIACGGDGTFNEVLNGAYGFENAVVGVLPIGTGNDFCRNFPDTDFKDISAHFNGIITECDVIRYQGIIDGVENTKYCANMFNIGFDCNVADTMVKLKKLPFIKGHLAYFLSIFIMMISKKGADLKIEIDKKEVHNGKLLLTSIANGCYCGGGIKSNPYATTNDGYMDINIVKNIPRYMFATCLPQYMKGIIFENNKYSHIAFTTKCKNIVITPNNKMRLCVDGEIYNAQKIDFSIISKGIKILKPINSNNHYHLKKKDIYEKNTISR